MALQYRGRPRHATAQRSLGILAKGDLFPVEALHESRPHFATFRAAEPAKPAPLKALLSEMLAAAAAFAAGAGLR